MKNIFAILVRVCDFLFKTFIVVLCIGIICLMTWLAHNDMTKSHAPAWSYWIAVVGTFIVTSWLVFPWFLIFPVRMSKEDWEKYRRL